MQQFYDKTRFSKFLDENFVLFRAQQGDPSGEKLYKKFYIRSTPFLLFLGPGGKEVDWIAGYTPPPEKLQARMLRILKGIDTLPSLAMTQSQDPGDPEPFIKLGIKYQERQYREKALECFKKLKEAQTNLDIERFKFLVQVRDLLGNERYQQLKAAVWEHRMKRKQKRQTAPK